MICTDHEILFG